MDTRILPPDLFDTPVQEKKKESEKKAPPVVESPKRKAQPKEKSRKSASRGVSLKAPDEKEPEPEKKSKNKKKKNSPDVAPKSIEIKPVEKPKKTNSPVGERVSPGKKTAKKPKSAEKKEPSAARGAKARAEKQDEKNHHEKKGVSDFPWESGGREERRVPCPGCGEPVHPDSTACIHCGAQFMTCPHCNGHSAALHNPKMATEQRLNKILRQYTLFSLALPALPLQPILDCSACGHRVIFCEQCHKPIKPSAERCPSCDFRVRRTKLIVNPFSLFESLFRRPDMGKSLQKAVMDLFRSLSEW